MNKYEKPQFKFEELKLFERVADVCWGTDSVWLDTNGDNAIDKNIDISIDTGGGCQGKESAKRLNDAIGEFNEMVIKSDYGKIPDVVKDYNSYLLDYLLANPGYSLTTINLTADSNWASTKESSGGGIIIVKS